MCTNMYIGTQHAHLITDYKKEATASSYRELKLESLIYFPNGRYICKAAEKLDAESSFICLKPDIS